MQVEVEAEYAPELFTLQPQLADLVGMLHGTRQSILHTLWHYIHLNKLQVLSERQSRCCSSVITAVQHVQGVVASCNSSMH